MLYLSLVFAKDAFKLYYQVNSISRNYSNLQYVDMSELVKRILKHGELFDKDFEDLGVPVDRSGTI